MSFLNALPGAVAQGLIWGLVAIGVYISYKILDIADLSVDGSICTGGCVCAVMLVSGAPIWLAMLLAFLADALAGTVTGLLHTALGIPAILAGILTQLMLYTVNLCILGGKSLVSLIGLGGGAGQLLMRASDNTGSIVTGVVVVAVVIIGLWLFFYTEVGLTLKSTGDNPDMSCAQGVNVKFNKVLGLAISNAIVALAGALYVQYKGSVSLQDGRGAIVIALAAIYIGLSVSLRIKPNFVVSLIGVVGGGIVYYIIYNFVILLGLKTDYLKMLSALIVVIFLAVPYLKSEYFQKRQPVGIPGPTHPDGGGDTDA